MTGYFLPVLGPTGQIKCETTSEAEAGHSYHHSPSHNYNPPPTVDTVDDLCLQGETHKLQVPDGKWLFRRDTILTSPECSVQWQKSVLHYTWRLLFSSHGAVSSIVVPAPSAKYHTVLTDCFFGLLL